jgi:hypothetical protein
MFEVAPFLDRACMHVKESVKGAKAQLAVLLTERTAEDDRLPDVMQNVAQRIDIAQKHLMQPMQSGDSLRRDSILVEFAQANFDCFGIDQCRPKLFFHQLQYVVHSSFDAIKLEGDYPASCRRTLVTRK